jgi:polyisoprenoid-binding protein YceI
MTPTPPKSRKWWWIGGGAIVVVLLAVVGGPFVYIHFIAPDPAPKLTISDSTPTTSAQTSGSEASTRAPLAGTWNVGTGSKAQYRVKETLFGQDAEATGTTESVTGSVVIKGTTVQSATVTVDLTTVTSDEASRDRQFQGRIMDTADFPDATFKLTQPIALGKEPADGVKITATATGELTMHGTTNTVTAQLEAKRTGDTIEIAGTIPVTFSDYGIDNPSGGPATVGNNGTIEFLVVLSPA